MAQTKKKVVTEKKVVKKAVEHVRKVQCQANGSTTVALPPELLRELKWRDKQKVVVKLRGTDTIIISDWKPKK